MTCLYCEEGLDHYRVPGGGSYLYPLGVIKGAYETLSEEVDEYDYPQTSRLKCSDCNRVWAFKLMWPDRPPLVMEAELEPPTEE